MASGKFPSQFQLITAANLALWLLWRQNTYLQVLGDFTYQSKIGGPLMDRIDIVCDVARPSSDRVIQGELGLIIFVISGRDFAPWQKPEVESTFAKSMWRVLMNQHYSYCIDLLEDFI